MFVCKATAEDSHGQAGTYYAGLQSDAGQARRGISTSAASRRLVVATGRALSLPARPHAERFGDRTNFGQGRGHAFCGKRVDDVAGTDAIALQVNLGPNRVDRVAGQGIARRRVATIDRAGF